MNILLFANTDWYLYNFRSALARELKRAGHTVLLASPPGPYAERLQQGGFPWFAAPMRRRSLNPFQELRLILWLYRLLVTEKIDVVHGFTIKNAVYSALASRAAGCSCVCAVAGMGFVFSSGSASASFLRPLVRFLLRISLSGERSRLILQNPDDVEFFVRQGIAPSSKVHLIRGSGVDCSRFTQTRPRAPGEPLRVLLAARLLWDKGLREFVEAARILKGQGRAVHFTVAGASDPGSPAAVPEDVIRGWVEEGAIEWLGHVDDMPALLSRTHVMALPTYYGEGVPRSLIEAAASGLALVATNAPGCREVICHGVDGLLVPLRDGSALADAIQKLDDDPGLAGRLGAAAREKAVNAFDERIVLEQTLAVYERLVEKHPA